MTAAMDLDINLRAYALPWAKVSTATPAVITATNISQVRAATGLDWEPETEPAYRAHHIADTPEGPISSHDIPLRSNKPHTQFVTRGLNGPIIDSTRGSYPVYGNGEFFETAEAIGVAGIELGREVKFLAGGEINGGKTVFLLADLGVRHLPGDPSPHVSYMGMVNHHDGHGSIKFIGTSGRWFCGNQVHAAEATARKNGACYSFKHTSNMRQRIRESMKAITEFMTDMEIVDAHARELLAIKVSPKQSSEFIKQFALAKIIDRGNPMRREKAATSPLRQNALVNLTGDLSTVLASRTCDGIRDTAYGLFATAVEFLDNRRKVASADTLFSRTMLNMQPDKRLALTVLRTVL